MKTVLKHLRDMLVPLFVTIILPVMINRAEQRWFGRPLLSLLGFQLAAGVLIGLVGLTLMLSSMILMIRIAQSTVMPWDPSKHLVIAGPYRHVRNPMILGVIILLVGEALVLSSYGIGILVAAFFILNTLYFIHFEEPQLEAQFGDEYRQYQANVRRWMPRVKPWYPQEKLHENSD